MRPKRIIKALARRIYRYQLDTQRSWRPEWLPKRLRLHLETSVHPHVPRERSELFLSYDKHSTEIEVLNWLHATVCLTKPRFILETGIAQGLGTRALAQACKANGFGTVHSIDIDPMFCAQAERMLRAAGLQQFVQIHCADSRTFLQNTTTHFDFGFFDSLPELRAEEYAICMERGILQGVAVFHDTSPFRPMTLDGSPPKAVHEHYRKQLLTMARLYGNTGFLDSPLSRGVFAIFNRMHDE